MYASFNDFVNLMSGHDTPGQGHLFSTLAAAAAKHR